MLPCPCLSAFARSYRARRASPRIVRRTRGWESGLGCGFEAGAEWTVGPTAAWICVPDSHLPGEIPSKTIALQGGRPTFVNVTNDNTDGWLHDKLYLTESESGTTTMIAVARLWVVANSPTELVSRSIIIPAGMCWYRSAGYCRGWLHLTTWHYLRFVRVGEERVVGEGGAELGGGPGHCISPTPALLLLAQPAHTPMRSPFVLVCLRSFPIYHILRTRKEGPASSEKSFRCRCTETASLVTRHAQCPQPADVSCALSLCSDSELIPPTTTTALVSASYPLTLTAHTADYHPDAGTSDSILVSFYFAEFDRWSTPEVLFTGTNLGDASPNPTCPTCAATCLRRGPCLLPASAALSTAGSVIQD